MLESSPGLHNLIFLNQDDIAEVVLILAFLSFSMCVWGGGDARVYVEVGGQLAGIGSLLQPCGFWELNSGYPAWCQVPSFNASSCWSDIANFD